MLISIIIVQFILHHHSQEAQGLESAIHLNYIETTDSVLHEMPWVVVKEYKVCYGNLHAFLS